MKSQWILIVVLLFLSGCNTYPIIEKSEIRETYKKDILFPIPSNKLVKTSDFLIIDYSNTSQGYIMVKTTNSDHKRLKLRISKDNNEYTYDIPKEEVYISYPLTFNDGVYNIKVFENVNDNNYALIENFDIEVKLDDDKYPYLYPSVIVDYDINSKIIDKSFELCKDVNADIERVFKIHKWITENIDYDYEKIDDITFVYPDLEKILETQEGVCFDYAALMTAMLRIQGVPTKLVTGNVEEGYHAWVEVYIKDKGWINPEIYFDGDYVRIDPTYDAKLSKKYDGFYEEIFKY